jgi:hypothetical protein
MTSLIDLLIKNAKRAEHVCHDTRHGLSASVTRSNAGLNRSCHTPSWTESCDLESTIKDTSSPEM